VVISDDGSYFINHNFKNLLTKYEVRHKVTTAYHPQINDQVKIYNGEIKNILKKMMGRTRKN
jgi:hypothetical protein